MAAATAHLEGFSDRVQRGLGDVKRSVAEGYQVSVQ